MAKTSKAFVADLPDMSEEQMEKLYAWGQSSCLCHGARLSRRSGQVSAVVYWLRRCAGWPLVKGAYA